MLYHVALIRQVHRFRKKVQSHGNLKHPCDASVAQGRREVPQNVFCSIPKRNHGRECKTVIVAPFQAGLVLGTAGGA